MIKVYFQGDIIDPPRTVRIDAVKPDCNDIVNVTLVALIWSAVSEFVGRFFLFFY